MLPLVLKFDIKALYFSTKLLFLYCDSNKLSELPDLPNTLKCLMCNYNNLIELPDLPLPIELGLLICNVATEEVIELQAAFPETTTLY